MKITFLGTGTSVGVPRIGCECAVCTSTDRRNKRMRCSILIEYFGRTVLVDTPPDLRTQALRYDVRSVDAVLFTHGHADHLHGLDDVRAYCFGRDEPIPVYGKGDNVRDWLFVDDHVRALVTVLERGASGETYNIGGHNEQTNLDVVHAICGLMDDLHPEGAPHADLISFVTDRPGHDWRYAIDASKIERDLGWTPDETFETGLRQTVQWYLDNGTWTGHVRSGSYRMERLGTAA